MKLKAIYCTVVSIAFVIASDLTSFHDAKFIACLSFGYTCFRFWGPQKPSKELGNIFTVIAPILFGTVGAGLKLSSITPSIAG